MDERIQNFKTHVSAQKQHRVDQAIDSRDRDYRILKRQYKDLLEDHTKLLESFDFVSQFDPDGVSPMHIAPDAAAVNDESIAMANASDWHLFESVDPAQVSGLNEYNPEIAQASVDAFFRGVVRWTEIHRAGTEINTLMLNVLGDIITGMLHMDQVEGNAGTPPEETLFAIDLLIGGIDYLIEHGGFKRIIINAVDGNHGRTTDKIRHANRVKHSYEWLMYKILQKWYKDSPVVTWNISRGYHLYVPVWDKMIRFHHGDAVRYQGGVGGITIPVLKAIKEWNTGRHADLDVFGHWHTMIDDSRFISNGCLLGYSPYSLSIKAPFQPPQQSFVVLNRKRWLTSFNRVYVR